MDTPDTPTPARRSGAALLAAAAFAACAMPALAEAPSATRGQAFFTQTHGREWSCSSCHGAVPVGTGRHAATGKAIEPLAPAANPRRFTDTARTEKWFRRNCNDVLGRECSAGEKADVMAFLQGLKP